MFIIDAIPLKKIPRGAPQVLSYYHAAALPAGSIGLGEIRKKPVPVFVMRSTPAQERKSALRSQDFQLKPLGGVISKEALLSKPALDLLSWLTKYFFAVPSSLVSFALPSERALLGSKKELFNAASEQTERSGATSQHSQVCWYVVGKNDQAPCYEHIQKICAAGKNVIVMVPHDSHVASWKIALEKISLPVTAYARPVGPRAMKAYLGLRETAGTVLIGTRSVLFAPLSHVGLVVIAQEESPLYYPLLAQPFFNAVSAAEKLAELAGADILMTSTVPSVARYHSYSNVLQNIGISGGDGDRRLSFETVDMRHMMHEQHISGLALNALRDIAQKGGRAAQLGEPRTSFAGRAVLFLNRRGYATSLMCRECGWHATCEKCATPLVLHQDEASQLVCHRCGFKRGVMVSCGKCGNRPLVLAGTGVQKVAAELRQKLSDLKVIPFDSDTLKTPAQERRAFEEFWKSDRAVLVTTELALKYPFPEQVDVAVMINFDHMLHLPDFQIEERIRRIAGTLGANAKRLIIQTYDPERPFLKTLGDLRSSYERELAVRKQLGYPPFRQLVRLVLRHPNQKEALAEGTRVAKLLSGAGLEASGPLPCFTAREKNRYCFEIIIRCERPVTEKLLTERNNALRIVPPEWNIFVDPLEVL